MEGIKRLAEMLEGQKDKYLIIIVNHLMLQTEMNVIEDAVVFKWAKEYFMKSNKELGIKETRLDRGKHGDVSKVETKENEDNFGSIFDIDDNNENTSDNSKKEDIEQISLFAA